MNNKLKRIVLPTLLVALLSSCGMNKETKTVVDDVQTETPSPVLQEEIVPVETFEEIIYVNSELGFKLSFPESWRDWYVVDQPEDGVARVKFYGKSKTGTVAGLDYFGGGLPMFYIISEDVLNGNTPWDNAREIGKVGDKSLYYVTGTGSDITALLTIADEKSAVRQTANYTVDEEEIELAEKDWEKANEMLEDVEQILKTFSTL